jgi:hypothetical protein
MHGAKPWNHATKSCHTSGRHPSEPVNINVYRIRGTTTHNTTTTTCYGPVLSHTGAQEGHKHA